MIQMITLPIFLAVLMIGLSTPVLAVSDSTSFNESEEALSDLWARESMIKKAMDSLEAEENLKPKIGFQYIFSLRHTAGPWQGNPRSTLSQEIRMAVVPEPVGFLSLDLGLRTEKMLAVNYSRGLSLSVDQASATIRPTPWISASAGRIYFILDRLGLIADNYHDALEGLDLKIGPWKVLGARAIYARLSSTNYPGQRFFWMKDDYWALRTYLDWGRLELGGNWLFSGISTEKGYALDGYLALWGRELAGEFAKYKPSATNWYEAVTWRQAWVAGMDVLKGKRQELFIQLGDVDRGFSPMASSLLYSTGGQHLYFDYNTEGVDATWRWWLARGEGGSAKPDREYAYNPVAVAEVEWVGLRDQEKRPATQRFIARVSLPLWGRANLMAEDLYLINFRPESGATGGHNFFSLVFSIHF